MITDSWLKRDYVGYLGLVKRLFLAWYLKGVSSFMDKISQNRDIEITETTKVSYFVDSNKT